MPRSFKVPRAVRSVTGLQRDPVEAMARAYRKFNWGYIGPKVRKHGHKKAGSNSTAAAAGAQPAASNSTGGDDGEVAASPEDNGALFTAPVNIGGQTLNMDFDTGSSDL